MILFVKLTDMPDPPLKRKKEEFVKNCMFVPTNIERQYLYYHFLYTAEKL